MTIGPSFLNRWVGDDVRRARAMGADLSRRRRVRSGAVDARAAGVLPGDASRVVSGKGVDARSAAQPWVEHLARATAGHHGRGTRHRTSRGVHQRGRAAAVFMSTTWGADSDLPRGQRPSRRTDVRRELASCSISRGWSSRPTRIRRSLRWAAHQHPRCALLVFLATFPPHERRALLGAAGDPSQDGASIRLIQGTR